MDYQHPLGDLFSVASAEVRVNDGTFMPLTLDADGVKKRTKRLGLWGFSSPFKYPPGPGDTLLHVVAGDSQAVAKRGQELCAAAWFHEPPQHARCFGQDSRNSFSCGILHHHP